MQAERYENAHVGVVASDHGGRVQEVSGITETSDPKRAHPSRVVSLGAAPDRRSIRLSRCRCRNYPKNKVSRRAQGARSLLNVNAVELRAGTRGLSTILRYGGAKP